VLAVDIAGIGTEVCPGITIEADLEAGIDKTNPDVIVDFTQPDNVYKNVKTYINKGVKSVIGTTGLMPEQIKEIEKLSQEKNIGVIIAPNFSIGAVLMMMFSGMAAKYFDNAEILEFHHNQKKDAPSGTAIKTAEIMRREKDNFMLGNCPEKETIDGARGANHDGNIKIHSIRMPGFVASQEVVFGSSGQTLKIRHDSIDRKCYMSGVLLAIRNVFENNKFIYGLENIL
jgi:4-hydroxy-tetrahydrodipicolinate reductase